MATNQVLHVRRCHVCGTVNEEAGASVTRCSKCGKHLAPFYFFEESRLEGIGDDRLETSLWDHHTLLPENYRPLWGFSTYWQLDEAEPEVNFGGEFSRHSFGN